MIRNIVASTLKAPEARLLAAITPEHGCPLLKTYTLQALKTYTLHRRLKGMHLTTRR